MTAEQIVKLLNEQLEHAQGRVHDCIARRLSAEEYGWHCRVQALREILEAIGEEA